MTYRPLCYPGPEPLLPCPGSCSVPSRSYDKDLYRWAKACVGRRQVPQPRPRPAWDAEAHGHVPQAGPASRRYTAAMGSRRPDGPQTISSWDHVQAQPFHTARRSTQPGPAWPPSSFSSPGSSSQHLQVSSQYKARLPDLTVAPGERSQGPLSLASARPWACPMLT